MRMISIAASLALAAGTSLVGAGAAVAANSADPAPVAASPAATPAATRPDRSRRICRSFIPVGTRLGVRTCRTQQEWDEEMEEARAGMEAQSRINQSVRPGAFTAKPIGGPQVR